MLAQQNKDTYLRLLTLDVGLTLLALYLAKFLRETLPLGVYLDEPLHFSPWLNLTVPLIWGLVFAGLKLYSPARALRYPEDMPLLWGAVTGACLIFAGVAYLLFRELSRLLFFYFIILDLLLLSGWRWLLPRWPRLARRVYGRRPRRVLIVGTGPLAGELARAIQHRPATNLSLIGFVAEAGDSAPVGGPVLGRIDQLLPLTERYQPDEIILALPPGEPARLRHLVNQLHQTPANLRLVPEVFDLIFLRASVETFEGIPLIGLREPALSGFDRLLKRLFDLAVSAGLLVGLAPLMVLIALLIKLDSPGPVFFRQQRVGEGQRLFRMIKFRSMVQGAEADQARLVQCGPDGRPRFAKQPRDPRVTRIGRLLRRTSLDELPQLINVWRGEMSLVGPRPELPSLVNTYEPWQYKRFTVPQGMTGWWQVNGRMQRPAFEQRVEDDLFYIRHYSLWLDLHILWKTINAVLHGEGAF